MRRHRNDVMMERRQMKEQTNRELPTEQIDMMRIKWIA